MNSVKAPKETKSTNSNQWPDLNLSFTTGLLIEGHCTLYAGSLTPVPVSDATMSSRSIRNTQMHTECK